MQLYGFERTLFALTLLANCATVSAKAQQPSLTETINFMSRAVAPDGRTLTTADAGCTMILTAKTARTFLIPDGVKSSKTKEGQPIYSFTWAGIQETDPWIAVKLGDLDIETLTTRLYPSPQFVTSYTASHEDDLSIMKHPDLAVVDFGTRDFLKSIEVGVGQSGEDTGSSQIQSSAFLVFQSDTRAETFVSALTYAAKLCGVKSS